MSFNDFLFQRSTISRPTAAGQGRYNQIELSPVMVAEDVPCRMVEKDMRLLDEKTGELGWVHVTLLLFAAGTDVQADDLIEISGEDGTWVAKKKLDRRAMNSIHHVSVIVEAFNG